MKSIKVGFQQGGVLIVCIKVLESAIKDITMRIIINILYICIWNQRKKTR